MVDRLLSRWMGVLGLLILVLLVVGFGPLSGNQPDENASGQSVANYLNAHQALRWAQIYVIGLGLALLVLYVCHLRQVLLGDGRNRALPNTAFVGGIILVAATVISGVSAVVLLLAAHNHQYAIVKTFNFSSQNDELGFLFGSALLALAAGLAIVTGGALLPKWLGWLAIVIGVLCVAGPISFIGFIAFGIWLPIAGFVIGSRERKKAKLDSAHEPTSLATPF
jgi:hypothetical protein